MDPTERPTTQVAGHSARLLACPLAPWQPAAADPVRSAPLRPATLIFLLGATHTFSGRTHGRLPARASSCAPPPPRHAGRPCLVFLPSSDVRSWPIAKPFQPMRVDQALRSPICSKSPVSFPLCFGGGP